MQRLAFATHRDDSDHGGERARLAPLLADLGIAVEAAVWDDPEVDWTGFDGVVVRSTWDYFTKPREFDNWVERANRFTRLANPAAVIRWNADKRYLLELAEAGIPIIETRVLEAPTKETSSQTQPERTPIPDWEDMVVKPAISGGSRLSGRFKPSEHQAAESLIAAIHAEGVAVLLQPYLDRVDTDGETNVLIFGGQVSHAVNKGTILSAEFKPDAHSYQGQAIAPEPLNDGLRTFATEVLDAVMELMDVDKTELVHARVDSVIDADGQRLLMEVELIEPYLYLEESPDPRAAAERYAQAISDWLNHR